MDGDPTLSSSLKRPYPDSPTEEPSRPRRARPKTSKACNACRKQKSRCERLAGDLQGCHRCEVIGIPCIFQSDLPADSGKDRKPRQLLPRSSAAGSAGNNNSSSSSSSTLGQKQANRNDRHESPDNSRLHVLANTTEMLREQTHPRAHAYPQQQHHVPTPKTPLSPQTLSTVESTLFPPRDSICGNDTARFRADWQRWVAPLTLIQTLVRRNAPAESQWRQATRASDADQLTPSEELHLKNHFRIHYSPWLPAINLCSPQDKDLSTISPFLSTVICATAARTTPDISPSAVSRLRELALHHVGQIFANPTAYPLTESLYGLLILALWPLDAADDVALLVHGAKRMAGSLVGGRFGGAPALVNMMHPGGTGDAGADGAPNPNLDQVRLWYAICANEVIFSLGAGALTTPPPVEDLINSFGTPSALALNGGFASDVILLLQTNLHRISTAAIGERGLHPVSSTSPSSKNMPGPGIPRTKEGLLSYVNTVYMFLTRFGEWEIEFTTIASECPPSARVHYTALEIEYHYLILIFITHCLLTVCHALPLMQASDDIKYALWSWSITGNKSAHAIVRLFNTYSIPSPEHPCHCVSSPPSPRTSSTSPSCSRGCPQLSPLALAPDRLFAMVVIAVMLILRHQVASYEYGRRRGVAESPPAGFTKQAEMALRRAVERMASLSVQPRSRGADGSRAVRHVEQAASRYAEILEALMRIWEERHMGRISTGKGPLAHPAICALFTSARQSSQTPVQSSTPDTECSPGASASSISGGGGGGHPQTPLTGSALHPEHQHQHQPQNNNQFDMDLSAFGGDLFSDVTAAFTWDGLGSLDWGGNGPMGMTGVGSGMGDGMGSGMGYPGGGVGMGEYGNR